MIGILYIVFNLKCLNFVITKSTFNGSSSHDDSTKYDATDDWSVRANGTDVQYAANGTNASIFRSGWYTNDATAHDATTTSIPCSYGSHNFCGSNTCSRSSTKAHVSCVQVIFKRQIIKAFRCYLYVTFHSNATISAPPTTNNQSATGSSAVLPEAPKAPAVLPAGNSGSYTSKIMHPPEDLSLEELRARKPKYQKLYNCVGSNNHSQRITSIGTQNINHNTVVSSGSSTTIPTNSSTSSAAAAQATAISKAQEVSSYHRYRNHSQYNY